MAFPSAGGGGGGTFDGMETRVSRLEEDMKKLKADMKTALKDLAYLKGKVDNLPTTLQLIGFAVAIFYSSRKLGATLLRTAEPPSRPAREGR